MGVGQVLADGMFAGPLRTSRSAHLPELGVSLEGPQDQMTCEENGGLIPAAGEGRGQGG